MVNYYWNSIYNNILYYFPFGKYYVLVIHSILKNKLVIARLKHLNDLILKYIYDSKN